MLARQEPSAVTTTSAPDPFTPTTYEGMMSMCVVLSNSALTPQAFRGKPNDVFIVLQMAHELKVPAMQALQGTAVINGKPAMYGDLPVAIVRGSGLCEYITETIEGAGEDRVAICKTKRKGEPHEVVRTFSWRDAKKAQLIGKQGPWSQYENRMLAMRARSFCLRDTYADALKGMQFAEEVADYAPAEAPALPGADRAAEVKARLASRVSVAPAAALPEVETPAERIKRIRAEKGLTDDDAFRALVAEWTGSPTMTKRTVATVIAELEAYVASPAETETSTPEAQGELLDDEHADTLFSDEEIAG